MPKKSNGRVVRKKVVELTPHQQHMHDCPGCYAREDIIVHLKSQVQDLQNKLLSLIPEAMDRYHRLEMTKTAAMRPEALDGVIPLGDVQPDEDRPMENFFSSMGAGASLTGKPKGR